MRLSAQVFSAAVVVSVLVLTGCGAPNVDFSKIEKPARAPEMDAFVVFVGSWDWQAKLINAEKGDEDWTGTAKWEWTLDERLLRGEMDVHGAHADFKSEGYWSWNTKSKQYAWWMFNNWGYPQEGVAKYDKENKFWRMKYKGVGLDGTTSYGLYTMKVVDHDHLEWTMTEWADAFRTVKKMEMTGTYTRR